MTGAEAGGIIILMVLVFTAGLVFHRVLMYMRKKYNYDKVYVDG